MVDFAKLKENISIVQCLAMLDVTVPQGSRAQLKLDCPRCASKNSLAVNTERNIAFCHTAKAGGSVIDITAHIKEMSVKDAAEWLEKGSKSPAIAQKGVAIERKGFNLETEPDHPAVEVTGLDPKIAARAGIGYASRGILKGTIAVPVFDKATGELLGYLGCTDFIVPPSLKGENIIEIKTA
jgi:hypothetical protein